MWPVDLHADHRPAQGQREILLQICELDEVASRVGWRLAIVPSDDDELARMARAAAGQFPAAAVGPERGPKPAS